MIAARLLQYAATLLLFGSASFFLYACLPAAGRLRAGAGPAAAHAHEAAPAPALSSPRWLWPAAAAAGSAAGLAWLSAEAASITGSWTAVADVVDGTHFGPVAVLRALLLVFALAASLALRPGRWRATLVGLASAAAAASFTWTGHGTADTGAVGWVHAGADVLHLLAAGLWMGALVELTLLAACACRVRTVEQARAVAGGLLQFSAIGSWVVAVLALTGLVNAWALIGLPSWQAILGTRYALVLLAKLALFAGMLVFAARNRLRLTPRLQAALGCAADCGPSLRELRASLLAETALAVLVLAAVAWLGTLEPPVHQLSESTQASSSAGLSSIPACVHAPARAASA